MTLKSPPPRETPTVILKEKEAYNFWLILHRDFPRTERFGLGQKIENIFWKILRICLEEPQKL